MPDNRYTEYEQRPVKRTGDMTNGAGASPRTAQQRSAQNSTQTRAPQSRPQGTNAARPAQRPSASQYGQTAPQPRGYAASGAPRQGAARPASAPNQTRPAQARPAQAGQAAQRTGAPARPRPAGSGSAPQRKPGQYAPASARPGANSPKRKTVSRSGYGYSGAAAGGFSMHPAAKAALFVLVVALLMTVSVIIADKVISSQPRPVISMNVVDPALTIQTTEQPAAPTDAPAATDAPVSPTDAPAVPTNEPAGSTTAIGDRSVTIRAIGDVIIDQATLDNCAIVKNEQYDFSPLFELVSGVMSDADWTMINIEGTLRKHKYGYMGYPQFSTPHSLLDDLKAAGVDMLTMCNNHALDGWYDGLKMSLDYADAAGLAHVGAYRTQEEHDTPEVYDIGGIKVGMVNYTQFTNGMAEKSDKEATIYGMRLMAGADYEGDIADLRNAGAEFTIAIMHWGTEYVREPDDDIEVIAKRLVAAGADLVIGGHPHVVQPAEYITATQADGTQNTALVIYSLGNFYSEHRKSYTDNGVIFEFTLSDDGQGGIEMSAPAFIPIYMWQNEGAGAYEFRAVPSGVYLNNPPAGMSDSQYERMKQSYQEIVDLVGGVIEVRAD